MVNLADFKTNRRRISALAAAAVIGAACFCTVILPAGLRFPLQAVQYQQHYENIRIALDTVPEDASVTATAFYIPYLSQREILYDVRHCSKNHLLETEFVVLAMNADGECVKYASAGMDNGFENLVCLLLENGYEEYGSVNNVLVIYRKGSQ